MTINQATAIIVAAAQAGQLTAQQAEQAQAAIRTKLYNGCAMTGKARASIITNRYGLVG